MDKIKYILFSEYTQLVLQSKKSDFLCFCIDVSMNCTSMKCPSMKCPSMKCPSMKCLCMIEMSIYWMSIYEVWAFRKSRKMSTASDQYFLNYEKELQGVSNWPHPAGIGLNSMDTDSDSTNSFSLFTCRTWNLNIYYCSVVEKYELMFQSILTGCNLYRFFQSPTKDKLYGLRILWHLI